MSDSWKKYKRRQLIYLGTTVCLFLNLPLPVLAQTSTNQTSQKESIQIKIDLARLYLKKKNYTKAIELLKQAYQLKPDDLMVNLELGLAYYLNQNFNEANLHYQNIEPKVLASGKTDLIKRLAFAYREMQKTAQAAELFKKLLALSPTDEQAYIPLGHIVKEQGQVTQANAYYESAYQIIQSRNQAPPEELAYGFKDVNNLQRAEEVFTKLLAKQPDNYRYLIELADLKTNPVDSLTLLNQALNKVPITDTYYFKLLAYRLFMSQQYEAARQKYAELHALNPNDFETILSLAGVYQILNQPQQALEFFQKARQVLNTSTTTATNEQIRALAYGFRQYKAHDQALEMLKSIQNPPYQVTLDIADTYFLLKDLTEAHRYYQQALTQWESKKDDNVQQIFTAYLNLSHINARLNEPEKALNALHLAQQIAPPTRPIYTQLAYQYRLLKQFAASNELLLTPIVQNEPQAETYVTLGDNSFDLKQPQQANLYYLTALELLKPQQVELKKNLMLGFIKLKDYERVEGLLAQLMAEKPEDYEILLYAGRLAREKNQPEQALKIYEKLAQLIPTTDGDMYRELGNEYLQLHHNQLSLNNLKLALKLRPDDHNIHLMLGHNYQALGRYPLAAEHYQYVLESEELRSHGAFNLGLIKRAIGQPQVAIRLFQEAAKLDPTYQQDAQKLVRNIQSDGLMIGDNHRYFFDITTQSNEIFLKAAYTEYLNTSTHHDWESKFAPLLNNDFHLTPHLLLNYENFLGSGLDIHRVSTGLKLHNEYFFKEGWLSSFSVTPQAMYHFASGQNSTLHYGSTNLTTNFKPLPNMGLETSGQLNFGDKDLFMGSFLNYSVRGKANYFISGLDLAFLTQFQNYEIFDGLARLRNIYRFENGFEFNYKGEQFAYQGRLTLSKITGEIDDTIIETHHQAKYNFWKSLSIIGDLGLTKFFLDVQQPQSVLSPMLGLEYELPFPAGFPVALSLKGRYNYFFDANHPGHFHYFINLSSKL